MVEPASAHTHDGGRRVDPVTVSVLGSAFRAISFEMSEALERSSYSPIVREMLDFSCAIFTAEGETVAQDDNIPAFMGTMAVTIPHVIETAEGVYNDGDAYISNDPYRGGTHTPDVQVFLPLVRDGRLIAWVGNIAHHTDLGGPNPGTEGFANRSIFAEGMRIPPLKLIDAGRTNEQLLRFIDNNVRDPESVGGDLRAQIAAATLGARRIVALVDRYGVDEVTESMAEILDQSERRIRASIRERPDGTATAEGYIDDGGDGGEPVKLKVKVSVIDDEVSIDMTGTDPQVEGGLNLSQAASRCASYFAVKATFDPEAPHDGGFMRAISINLPPGTLANPEFPAAVSLRHLTVLRLTDTLVGAFGSLFEDRSVAGASVAFSSLAADCRHPRRGHRVVIQDDLGGGLGGHAEGDGLDAVDVYLGNVKMLPAEMCELEYTVRIVETSLLEDSAGEGQFRGGLGIQRTYEFLEDSEAVVYSEQTRPEFAPKGVDGGGNGEPARLVIQRADGSSQPISKATPRFRAGDRLVVRTPGGGGFGDPARRSAEALAADRREGKMS
jgi:N-methylhydantoinase B